MKSHFGMGVLQLICCIFSEHIFLRTPLEDYFWPVKNQFSKFRRNLKSFIPYTQNKKFIRTCELLLARPGSFLQLCNFQKYGRYITSHFPGLLRMIASHLHALQQKTN